MQENCLSSDDFHEALFLDKKSPSRTLNKKKRKSRKKDLSNLADDEENKIREACIETKEVGLVK